MPPRKSNQSANGAEDGGPVRDGISVEDLSLPKTMIQRLAKGVLPANTQIQKDALLALSKSATVFVNYLSSHAGENATRANKKTIQPKDVFDAIHDLEFDGFLPRLEAELTKYNTIQCDKRNTYRRKVREEMEANKYVPGAKGSVFEAYATMEEVEAEMDRIGDSSGPDEPPAAKKIRRSDAEGGDPMAVDEGADDGGERDADQEQDQDDDEVEHDEVDDEEDEEGYDDPNLQLVTREDDPTQERENDGIGDEALDGDDSD